MDRWTLAPTAPRRGRMRIAQRFIAGTKRPPLLLLLAGEVHEEEEGGRDNEPAKPTVETVG